MSTRVPLLQSGLFFRFLCRLGVALPKAGLMLTHDLGFCFQLGQLLTKFLLFRALLRQRLPRLCLGPLEQRRLSPHRALELADPLPIRAARLPCREPCALRV